MDGFIANLPAICDLADKYDALVMVDDSHAVGFMGKTGRGTHEHHGVMGRVDILTGTLGKALGGASGGYTSGRKEIIELSAAAVAAYLFSNTLAPAIAGGVAQGARTAQRIDGTARQAGSEHPIFPRGDDRAAASTSCPASIRSARSCWATPRWPARCRRRDAGKHGVYVHRLFVPGGAAREGAHSHADLRGPFARGFGIGGGGVCGGEEGVGVVNREVPWRISQETRHNGRLKVQRRRYDFVARTAFPVFSLAIVVALGTTFAGCNRQDGPTVGQGSPKSVERDDERTIRKYDKMIRTNPDNAAAFLGRGIAKGRQGDREGAMRDYDEAIRLDPKYADALVVRGIEKNANDDPEGAIRDYDQAIGLDSKNANAYLVRGIAKRHKGSQSTGRCATTTTPSELTQRMPAAYVNRGIARREKQGLRRGDPRLRRGHAVEFGECQSIRPARNRKKGQG